MKLQLNNIEVKGAFKAKSPLHENLLGLGLKGINQSGKFADLLPSNPFFLGVEGSNSELQDNKIIANNKNAQFFNELRNSDKSIIHSDFPIINTSDEPDIELTAINSNTDINEVSGTFEGAKSKSSGHDEIITVSDETFSIIDKSKNELSTGISTSINQVTASDKSLVHNNDSIDIEEFFGNDKNTSTIFSSFHSKIGDRKELLQTDIPTKHKSDLVSLKNAANSNIDNSILTNEIGLDSKVKDSSLSVEKYKTQNIISVDKEQIESGRFIVNEAGEKEVEFSQEGHKQTSDELNGKMINKNNSGLISNYNLVEKKLNNEAQVDVNLSSTNPKNVLATNEISGSLTKESTPVATNELIQDKKQTIINEAMNNILKSEKKAIENKFPESFPNKSINEQILSSADNIETNRMSFTKHSNMNKDVETLLTHNRSIIIENEPKAESYRQLDINKNINKVHINSELTNTPEHNQYPDNASGKGNQTGENYTGKSGLSNNYNHNPIEMTQKSDAESFSKLIENSLAKKDNNVKISSQKVDLPSFMSFSRIKIGSVHNILSDVVKNSGGNYQGSVRMILSPKSLGTIFVELSVSDNSVKLGIKSDNKDTVKALEGSIGILKERIESTGVKIDYVNINHYADQSNREGTTSRERQNESGRKSRAGIFDLDKLINSEEIPEAAVDKKYKKFQHGNYIETYI